LTYKQNHQDIDWLISIVFSIWILHWNEGCWGKFYW